MSLQSYKEDFFLLVEAGFIAVNQFDEDAAIKLFKAAELLNPANTLPHLGKGYMHLCKLELKAAIALFEKILAQEPDNTMAKTLLGLSLSFNPTEVAKGEKTLEEALKSSDDKMTKNLATTALEFVRKFVKKSPSPAQTATAPSKPDQNKQPK